MKRQTSDSLPSTRRKSARLKAQRISKPQPSSLNLQGLKFPELRDHFEAVCRVAQRPCKIYNRYIPFAKQHTGTHARAAAVEKAARDIEDFIESATQTLIRKVENLAERDDEFVDSLESLPSFYQGGDLLSLQKHEIESALLAIEDEDGEDFARYVLRIIPAAVQEKPPDDEKNCSDLDYYVETDSMLFFSKVFMLIQGLVDVDRDVEALHAMAVFKSTYRNRNERLTRFHGPHEKLDKAIKYFTVDHKIPLSMRQCGGQDRSDHNCLIEGSELIWESHPILRKRKFWDFASAMRPIQATYSDEKCKKQLEPEYDDDYDERHDRYCYHQLSLDLLVWLQAQAWSEIRFKVFSTIGQRLPAELIESIFDLALVAEEVPADPAVREQYTPSTDAERREQREFAMEEEFLNWGFEDEKSARGEQPRRIKDRYQCGRIQNYNPSRTTQRATAEKARERRR